MTTVVAVASGGQVNGVPVTQIQGGDRPPRTQLEQTPDLPDPDLGIELSLDAPQGQMAAHTERATIKAMSVMGNAQVEIWELVHWYYAANTALTTEILDALRAIVPTTFAVDVEPGLEPHATLAETSKALNWFQNNFRAVADAYVDEMKKHNSIRVLAGLPKIPDDHNVASLCLYSGPLPIFLKPQQYSVYPRPNANWGAWKSSFYRPQVVHVTNYRSAWLATGDAMLKKIDIWNDFESHYGSERLDGCLTVQIPHHGADAPSSYNYNQLLIRSNQNCVISAGAKSKHGHPHKDVVKDIVAKPAYLRIVNENDHMGFIEHLKFHRK